MEGGLEVGRTVVEAFVEFIKGGDARAFGFVGADDHQAEDDLEFVRE